MPSARAASGRSQVSAGVGVVPPVPALPPEELPPVAELPPLPTEPPLPVLPPLPVEIDEEMLTAVARKTGGRYFRATDREALREIYSEIGELEKTEIEERVYTDYEERYARFLWPAFLLVMLEVLLSTTRLRRIP